MKKIYILTYLWICPRYFLFFGRQRNLCRNFDTKLESSSRSLCRQLSMRFFIFFQLRGKSKRHFSDYNAKSERSPTLVKATDESPLSEWISATEKEKVLFYVIETNRSVWIWTKSIRAWDVQPLTDRRKAANGKPESPIEHDSLIAHSFIPIYGRISCEPRFPSSPRKKQTRSLWKPLAGFRNAIAFDCVFFSAKKLKNLEEDIDHTLRKKHIGLLDGTTIFMVSQKKGRVSIFIS